MADLTPEALAEWHAHWTDLKERGGQDVIITPEFAIALLDELAMREAAKAIGLQLVERVKQEKVLRKQAEAELQARELHHFETEKMYADLRSALQGLRDSAEADRDCPTWITRALEGLL